MEVFYTSLNAKKLFSIPSTIRMIYINASIKKYSFTTGFIYIFFIFIYLLFFFFGVHGTSFIDLEEKETRTHFL